MIVTGLISRIRGTLSARANRTEGTTWKNLMMATFEIFASLDNLQAHVEGEAFIFAWFFWETFKRIYMRFLFASNLKTLESFFKQLT